MPSTAPTTVYLPNGYTLSATPSFGGMTFKTNDIGRTENPLPPGWSIVITTAEEENISFEDSRQHRRRQAAPDAKSLDAKSSDGEQVEEELFKMPPMRFSNPTLNRDSFFISSVFFPSDSNFATCKSPTRQTALMIWATLYWYFHLQEPSPSIVTNDSIFTPDSGKPKGPWRIYVKREGILKGRNLMPKLERMGLISTEDSTVGLQDTQSGDVGSGWSEMFVSRRSFWQIDPRIFLFSWRLVSDPSFNESGSSPRDSQSVSSHAHEGPESPSASTFSRGPFYSSSNQPTYFPPPPPQYTLTRGIRHPIRPKPPRQGETIYTRYIPSINKNLSFRVPALPPPKLKAVDSISRHRKSSSVSSLPVESVGGFSHHDISDPATESDIDILHRWMNNPRVNAAWGIAGPRDSQDRFLKDQLMDRHSFPVLGCWNGKPFGYFEIYWIKEDRLGGLIGGSVDDWDRGLKFLVYNDEDRVSTKAQIWISALVHYCFLVDNRTHNIIMEPRIDSERYGFPYSSLVEAEADSVEYRSIANLQLAGFFKQGEVSFSYKQSAVMKIKRDNWECPAI